ncbi:MAG: NAD-dependent epimerase/dehydratase family protein [Treponema sp.]
MVVVVTGAAGFIGYFLSKRLLDEGNTVLGVDSLNNYYSVSLKQSRLDILSKNKNFKFFLGRLEEKGIIDFLFENHKVDVVIHLAAQAGVRHSIENPQAYVDSNIAGFFAILESCRKYKVPHFLFASSSSVYGNNPQTPYTEDLICDSPLSLYAATKKSNELMAYSYSHLYQIPSTALRFFTVYGPYGRPDMAYFKFANKIMNDEPIQVFNNGKLYRDFTYIDDVIEAIIRLIPLAPDGKNQENAPEASTQNGYFDVFNIGNEHPVLLLDFIEILEEKLNKKAVKQLISMQKGDTYKTNASTKKLYDKIGWKPFTPLEKGLEEFAKWFLANR